MLRRFLLLLLLQVVYFTAQRSILFVDAKNESVLRGSNAKNQPLDGLPHRELPDASATQTKLVLKDITDNEKEKEPGRADINPRKIDDEKEPGRDDKDKIDEEIESGPDDTDPPIASTGSPTRDPLQPPRWAPTWNPVQPPTTTTATTFNPVQPPTVSPTSNPVPAPMMVPTDSKTTSPSFKPTVNPTAPPSFKQTENPSSSPIFESAMPSSSNNVVEAVPLSLIVETTDKPSIDMIVAVTKMPSYKPTMNPTASPIMPSTSNNAVEAVPFSLIVEDTVEPSIGTVVAVTKSPSSKPTMNPTASPIMSSTSNNAVEAAPFSLIVETTDKPSIDIIVAVTKMPSYKPTMNPTAPTSYKPKESPSSSPFVKATIEPSINTGVVKPSIGVVLTLTTYKPTGNPTALPSLKPTDAPSSAPIVEDTPNPTIDMGAFKPSIGVVLTLTKSSTSDPNETPTAPPHSFKPVNVPSSSPTLKATSEPSTDTGLLLTKSPTLKLTDAPSSSPIVGATVEPSIDTVVDVTKSPTFRPTDTPTASPTFKTTNAPSLSSILEPTAKPLIDINLDLTKSPSYKPTDAPTLRPSKKLPQAPSSSTNYASELESPLLSTVPPSQVSVADITSSGKAPADTTRPDNNESVDVKFDETKFVAGEKLQPIIFDMTVSNFTQTINTNKMKTYFIGFIKELLDMRSNTNWYPFHLKSVSNITIELVTEIFVEGDKEEHADPIIQKPVQLIITGLVFVHVKKQEVGTVASSQRTTGGKEKQAIVNDGTPASSLHDSFYHSVLLYFTFWGADSLQKVLEEDGGLQNPIISSVSVGDKELIAFGIDKDDNYLYKGDHDSSKPKNLPAQANTGISGRFASSAASLKFGFLTIIMMSAGITLHC